MTKLSLTDNAGALRVMIVEDSTIMRECLVQLLAGVPGLAIIGQLIEATGAADAIARLRPDAVTLDIRLPGGSGLDVLRAVKRAPQPPKVIILTSNDNPFLRAKCLADGADFFLTKATEFEQVAEILRGLAGNRGAGSQPPPT